jgi:hypothetical protein
MVKKSLECVNRFTGPTRRPAYAPPCRLWQKFAEAFMSGIEWFVIGLVSTASYAALFFAGRWIFELGYGSGK